MTEALLVPLQMDSLVLLTNPIILLGILLGTGIGIVFGAIPGFSATMTVILLTPVTIPFPPSLALIVLVSAYGGAVYGGSIPAILINTPGAPGSVVTCWDGYKLTQQGRATYALAASAFASGVAGILAALLLFLVAPKVAEVALDFGSTEMFFLAIFALTIIPAAKNASLSKGLLAGAYGLLIATVGSDPLLARPRATYGLTILRTGFDYIVILIGLFVITEMIRLGVRGGIDNSNNTDTSGGFGQVKEGVMAVISRPAAFFRAAGIGGFIGSLPGAGADVANFVSYNEAQRWASDTLSDKFGTGIIEGVIAAEASNNATQGGALIPTLTLGIPGSGSTAALLGALAIHGLNPGPGLFERSGLIVYAMIFSLFIGNALIIVYGLSGSKYFGKIAYIPVRYIIPVVTLLAIVGAFAVRNSGFDLYVIMAAGLMGLIFVAYDYPLVSPVLGVIVGPIAETGFARGWLLTGQDPVAFTTNSYISIILIGLIVFSLGATLYQNHA